MLGGDSLCLPATQREGLRVLGGCKLPWEGQQTQGKAPLCGQQRMARPLIFIPQEGSAEEERSGTLCRARPGLQRELWRQVWCEPKGAAQPQSCSWALWFRAASLCPREQSVQHSLLYGALSTTSPVP